MSEPHSILTRETMKSVDRLPGWKIALDEALKKDPNSRVFQLATISSSDPPKPCVRSLAFRTFINEGPRFSSRPVILGTTDERATKVSEIKENPSIEVVWWFAKAQEQFRMSGRAYMVFDPSHSGENEDIGGGIEWEERRREMFDELSGVTRAAFARPTPGTLLTDIDLKGWPETLPKFKDAKGEEEGWVKVALKNCVLLIVEPEVVDYLELGVMPHRRTRFEWKEMGWEKVWLVP